MRTRPSRIVLGAALVIGLATVRPAWPLAPPTPCPSCWVPPL